MNPCPNGCDIDEYGQCQCTQQQLNRYRNKISSPILDRIDLQVSVPKLPPRELLNTSNQHSEDWDTQAERIYTAFETQIQRQGVPNAQLEGENLIEACRMTQATQTATISMLEKLNLSARAFHKILKVARTIADLEQVNNITQTHLNEAMSYRQFDRLLKN